MKYFIYKQEFRLLYCRIYHVMITQKQVRVHLRNDPHRLDTEAVRAMQKWASKDDIFESQQDVHDNLIRRRRRSQQVQAR
jgi:hypothetical protein